MDDPNLKWNINSNEIKKKECISKAKTITHPLVNKQELIPNDISVSGTHKICKLLNYLATYLCQSGSITTYKIINVNSYGGIYNTILI